MRVAYYLCASGWSFVQVPAQTSGFDVDVRMRTPNGVVADIQVKASDQLGRVEGYRRVDGEIDEHVTRGLAKAIKQIAPAPGPIRIVATCPLRDWPLSRRSGAVAAQMLGSTLGNAGGRVTLDGDDRGVFSQTDGAKVHAAIVLDFFRPVDGGRYGCTVFLNPWVEGGQLLSPDEFPYSAVCELISDRFRWSGSAGHCHVVPDGTLYLGN